MLGNDSKNQMVFSKLKTLPAEVYFFFALPICIFLLLLIVDKIEIGLIYDLLKLDGIVRFFVMGNDFFRNSLFVLQLYIIFKIAQLIGSRSNIDANVAIIPWHKIRNFILSALFIFSGVGLVGLISVLIVYTISFVTPESVVNASNLLMDWDFFIFGVYPPFFLQTIGRFGFIDQFIHSIYFSLTPMVMLMFFWAMASGAIYARKFLLNFYLVILLGAFIWIAIPAISPGEMYVTDVTALSTTALVSLAQPFAIDTTYISPLGQKFLNEIPWSHPENDKFAITTFPSFHVASATIIMALAFNLSGIIGIILIPWYVFLLFSTVYTLQHFAVDVPSGIAIAIVSMAIINWFVKKSDTQENSVYFTLYKTAKHDLEFVLQKMTQLFLRFFNKPN